MTEMGKKGFFTDEKGANALKKEQDPKRKYGPDVVLPSRPKTSYMIFMSENLKSVMNKENIKMPAANSKLAE